MSKLCVYFGTEPPDSVVPDSLHDGDVVLEPYHPLGRLGQPKDVADVVAFLVSPAGRWISGQLLNADGGFTARY